MVSLRDLPEKYTKRFEDQGIYETDNPFARAFQIGTGSLGQGLSQMTGLPVDLINMGLKKMGASEEELLGGGSEDFHRWLGHVGLSSSVKPRGTFEKLLARTGEEVGASLPLLIPFLGVGARAARLGGVMAAPGKRGIAKRIFTDPTLIRKAPPGSVAAQRLAQRESMGKIRGFTRDVFERAGADPVRASAQELAYASAAGMGAGVMREMYPNSLFAEVTGQILGPIGLGAAMYWPTGTRLLRKGYKTVTKSVDDYSSKNILEDLEKLDPSFAPIKDADGKPVLDADGRPQRNLAAISELSGKLDFMEKEFPDIRFHLAGLLPDNPQIQAAFDILNFTPDEVNMISAMYPHNEEAIKAYWSKFKSKYGDPGVTEFDLGTTLGVKEKELISDHSKQIKALSGSQRTWPDKIGGGDPGVRFQNWDITQKGIREFPGGRQNLGKQLRTLSQEKLNESYSVSSLVYDELGLNHLDVIPDDLTRSEILQISNDFRTLLKENTELYSRIQAPAEIEKVITEGQSMSMLMAFHSITGQALRGKYPKISTSGTESVQRSLKLLQKRIENTMQSLEAGAVLSPGTPTSVTGKELLKNINKQFKEFSKEELLDITTRLRIHDADKYSKYFARHIDYRPAKGPWKRGKETKQMQQFIGESFPKRPEKIVGKFGLLDDKILDPRTKRLRKATPEEYNEKINFFLEVLEENNWKKAVGAVKGKIKQPTPALRSFKQQFETAGPVGAKKLTRKQREIKADYLKGYRKEKGLEVMDIPPSPVPKSATKPIKDWVVDMLKEVYPDITPTSDVYDRFKAANAWYFNKHAKVFNKDFPIFIRKKGGRGFYGNDDEKILGQALKPDRNGGVEIAEQAVAAYGDDIRPIIEAVMTDDIARFALADRTRAIEIEPGVKGIIEKGTIDPNKVSKWIDDHRATLSKYGYDPEEVRRMWLEGPEGAYALAKRRQIVQERLNEVEKSAFRKKVSEYYDTETSSLALVQQSLKDAPLMTGILKRLGGDKMALNGFRRDTIDLAMKIKNPEELAGWIEKHKDSLGKLFTKSDIEKFSNVVKAKVVAYYPSPGGVVSVDDKIARLERFLGQSITSFQNQLWVTLTRFLPARFFITRAGGAILRRMGMDKWEKMVKHVMMNPKDLNYLEEIVTQKLPYDEIKKRFKLLYLSMLNVGLESRSEGLTDGNISRIIPIDEYERTRKMQKQFRKQLKMNPPTNNRQNIKRSSVEFKVVPRVSRDQNPDIIQNPGMQRPQPMVPFGMQTATQNRQ